MSLQITAGSDPNLASRHRASTIFATVCKVSTWIALAILLVLLISVAGQITHKGAVLVFVDSEDVAEQRLDELEKRLAANEAVASVRRDISPSGSVSFELAVKEQQPDADGKALRYKDVRTQLKRDCRSLDDLELTFDSSEPIHAWDTGFLTRYPSTLKPEQAGIFHAIWGSFWIVIATACFAVPVGVGAAVYLEEYAGESWLTRLIKLNLANLAGVPSIVYGILGFAVFVRFFGKKLMLGQFQIFPLGSTVITGGLTLALLVLPVIIVATQEALKSVPGTIRSASYALGATKWQTIRHQVLPAGMPGIATGVILALSRALGETAPILVIGVLAYVRNTPGKIESPLQMVTEPSKLADVPFDSFSTLPIQIYNWVQDTKPEFAAQAAKGILVLLVVLVCMNSIAIYIRHRFQKNLNW